MNRNMGVKRDPSKAKGKSTKMLSMFKRVLPKKVEYGYMNAHRNCWKSKVHLFLFCANLGNDIVIFPLTLRLALSVTSGAFIIILLIFSIVMVMPIVYTEIFLGRYTKLSASQMYKMAPFSFGFSIISFVVNILYYPVAATKISQYLISVLKLLISSRIFVACPLYSDTDSCYDYKLFGPLKNTSCSYKYMSVICSDGKEYRYPVQYVFWKSFKELGADLYPMWQFVISIGITWLAVTAISMLGMRILGMMMKTFYILYMLVFTIILIMSVSTPGGWNGIMSILDVNFNELEYIQVIAIFVFSFRKLGIIVPNGYMTYSAYTKFSRFGPSTEALIIVLLNMLQTSFMLLVFLSITGVLAENMGIQRSATVVPFEGIYMAMVTEFLTFKKCPNLFLIIYYISSWALEIVKLAISKHWLVMNIYDYFPQIRNFESYVRITLGIFFSILTLISAVEFFTAVLYPAIVTGHSIVTIGVEVFIQVSLIFYCYGVNRLSDDIQFVSGKRPIRFWRIMWYILPIIIFLCIIVTIFKHDVLIKMDQDLLRGRGFDYGIILTGLCLSAAILGLSLITSFLYIMLGFQQSKVATNVLKPQFQWGPPKREMRIARKLFAPRTAIRSQPNRKRKQRFRPHSIKQMREKDLVEHVKRGRIFLDNMFFRDVGIMSRKKKCVTDDDTIYYTG